jgi:hypothetical protein
VVGIVVILFLTGCAENLLVRWGQGQSLYNTAIAEVIRYRDPCVVSSKWPDGGPEHELCFIDDETMTAIVIVRDNARELLDRTRIAAEVGNDLKAEDYLEQAQYALEDLLFYQLRAAARAGEE